MGYSNVQGDLNVLSTTSTNNLVVRGDTNITGNLTATSGFHSFGNVTAGNLVVTGNFTITATNTQVTNALSINNAGTATALKVVQFEGGGPGHTYNVAEFWDFQTLAMVIDPEGNVGIHATSSPGYSLTVGDGSYLTTVTSQLYTGNGSGLSNLTTSNLNGLVLAPQLANTQTNITTVGILTNMNVSGGSNLATTNITSLNVSGSTNLASLNVASANIANIYTTNIVGFIGSQWTTGTDNIYYFSNVGIGTGAVSANLHVVGNIFASNALTTGSIFGTNLNVTGTSNLSGTNVTTLNASSIFGTNLNVTGTSNLSGTNVTTLNAASIFGTNLNVTGTSNLSGTNVTTLNAASIFGTNLNVTGTSNLLGTNVTTLNASSIFGTNLNVTGTSNLSGTNVTTLNAASIFGTNLNVTGTSNLLGTNVTTLNASSIFGTNLNVTGTSNLSGTNVTTLNASSIFGTNLNVTTGANLSSINVITLNSSSVLGTSLNITGVSNLSTINTTSINGSSIFGTNLNVTGNSNLAVTNVTSLNVTGLANLSTLNVASANIANIYTTNIVGFVGSQWTGTVGSTIYYLSNVGIGTSTATANLQVGGNVVVSNAITCSNLFLSGNANVLGYSNLVTANIGTANVSNPIPVTSGLYMNLNATYTLNGTGNWYGNIASTWSSNLYTLFAPNPVASWTVYGSNPLVTGPTANGGFKFSQTGQWAFTAVITADNNIKTIALSSNTADVHSNLADTDVWEYVYRTGVGQDPSIPITIPFYVDNTSKYYFLDIETDNQTDNIHRTRYTNTAAEAYTGSYVILRPV